MKTNLMTAIFVIAIASPTFLPADAAAQRRDDRGSRYDQDDRYDRGDRNSRGDRDNRSERDSRNDLDNRSDRRWQGDRDNGNWDPSSSYQAGSNRERRMGRNDRIFRGQDGRSYCKRNDGTTGLVVGAVGGGVLANLIGGGTLGTLAGAGGGALLGRSVDRGNVKCR